MICGAEISDGARTHHYHALRNKMVRIFWRTIITNDPEAAAANKNPPDNTPLWRMADHGLIFCFDVVHANNPMHQKLFLIE